MNETTERRALIQINKWPALPNEIRVIGLATVSAACLVNVDLSKSGIVWVTAGTVAGVLAVRDLMLPVMSKPRTSTSRATSSQFASMQRVARIEARPGLLARWGFGRPGWKTEDERNDHIIYTNRIAPRVQFTFDTIPGFCNLDTPIVEGDLLRFFRGRPAAAEHLQQSGHPGRWAARW